MPYGRNIPLRHSAVRSTGLPSLGTVRYLVYPLRPRSPLQKGEDIILRNFRRELHCNIQIIRRSELPDNLKLVLFYSSMGDRSHDYFSRLNTFFPQAWNFHKML